LKSVDALVETGADVQEIRWNTCSIVKDIIVKSTKSPKELLDTLIEYRNHLPKSMMENVVYWDHLIFSSLYQLISKTGLNYIEGSLEIQHLLESVLERELTGRFDSTINLLLVNQVLNFMEKSSLSDSLVDSLERITCLFESQEQGSKTWLLAFEMLCNWMQYLPHSVFIKIYESGWAHIGFKSVQNGFRQVIRLGGENSLFFAQNILSQINLIIHSLKHCGKEHMSDEFLKDDSMTSCVVGFLKLFFEMDCMAGMLIV
jgi:hypothetical protein